MTWKSEQKEFFQSHYGGYCKMCKKDKTKPLPYHKFIDVMKEKIKKERDG